MLNNDELRDAVSAHMMKKAGRREVAQCLNLFSGAKIHATRHAELLRKFTSENGIDLDDFGDLRIENSWEYEDVKGRYPFDIFNEKFQKLYDKESIKISPR